MHVGQMNRLENLQDHEGAGGAHHGTFQVNQDNERFNTLLGASCTPLLWFSPGQLYNYIAKKILEAFEVFSSIKHLFILFIIQYIYTIELIIDYRLRDVL